MKFVSPSRLLLPQTGDAARSSIPLREFLGIGAIDV
jgi:hypothetical protein